MFSDLNKVSEKLPTARDPRTKQTDTREEIRRHDPDHERKKGQHKGFAKEQGLFGDDQTEVSVLSLETFLPMLLKNFAAKPDDKADNVKIDQADQNNPNARAAGAYARTAQYNPPVKEETDNDTPDNSKDVDHPTLSNEEVKAIHNLQADVAKLKAKGVSVIYINKADTFLASLQNGVQEALTSA